LALAACSVLLCISYSASNAQQVAGTVDPTTGNIITNSWQGTTSGSYGGLSGGYMPGQVATDNAVVFGYNEGTASQSIAINSALAAGGAGIELKGYNYSWYYYNNDMNRGTLTGNISLRSATGGVLESYNYNMPQTGIGNWIPQSGSQLFTNPYQISQVSTLDVSFTGKDDRWWAGYYGPAIKAVNVKLVYGVDPCATNPAYSTTCAGFDKVVTSNNLVPNPTAYAYGGWSINQSYAINTALSSAGSGAQIHGFNWGYVANANGPYCGSWDMGFLGCWDYRVPSVNTNVNITNSAGASLYNVSRQYTNSYNTTNYSYLFPTSQTMSTLGSFNFSGTTNDQAYLGSMWSKAIYTVDPCAANPLYSPTCSGYGAAFAQSLNTTGTTTTTTTGVVSTDPAMTTTTADATTTGAVSSPTASSTASTGSTPSTTTTASTSSTDPSTGTTTTTTATTTTNPTTGASTTATSVATATPSANNPQPKVGEVTTAGSAPKATATVSTSQVLSMISSNNAKESALATSVAAAAVSQAAATATSAVSQAEAVAAAMSSQSASSSTQTTTQSTGTGLSTGPSSGIGSGFAMTASPQQAMNSSYNAARATDMSSASVTSATFGSMVTGTLAPTSSYRPLESTFGNTFNTASLAPAVSYSLRQEQINRTQTEIEQPKGEGIKLTGFNSVLNNSNTTAVQATMTEQKTDTVKKNVQDNSAASGVSIAAMATVPVGFAQYSVTLTDAAFYAPKEIYKNQRTVDNARAQRLLNGASDRVYQQMLDQQYKIGN
jgi:hypothetical protein